MSGCSLGIGKYHNSAIGQYYPLLQTINATVGKAESGFLDSVDV